MCLIWSLQPSFGSKSYHKHSLIHYMFIGLVETVTNRAVCTSNDVIRAYFGTSLWDMKCDFGATLDIEKNTFPR